MFVYEKKLQYPVRIANPNPKLASMIITQYGGRYTIKLRYRRKRKNKALTQMRALFFSYCWQRSAYALYASCRMKASKPAAFRRCTIFSALARLANAPTCTR